MSVMQRLRLPLFVLAALLATMTADAALAQAMRHPFAVGANEVGGASGGIMGWLLAEQSRFYLMLTSTIRAIRPNASAAWTLAGLSFVYGVFQADRVGWGNGVAAFWVICSDRAPRGWLMAAPSRAVVTRLV